MRRIFELSTRLGARFDALGQADLVVFTQHGMASDVGEIQLNEVRVVARGVRVMAMNAPRSLPSTTPPWRTPAPGAAPPVLLILFLPERRLDRRNPQIPAGTSKEKLTNLRQFDT
jgi:hypothetical protein